MKAKNFFWNRRILYILIILLMSGCSTEKQAHPLPSWNNGASKQRIIDFVKKASDASNPDYVPPAERIAVFDNDGTLWSEKPTYFQVEFVLYRIKQLAPKHPEWQDDGLFETAIKRDLPKLRKEYGAQGLARLMAVAQSGMATEVFEEIVREWIKNAKHPETGRLFSQMVYQPMLELIKYLQDNDFQVYIVSGGGIDFMRTWASGVYGIPRDHVLGSIPKYAYKKIKGKPVLIKKADILFVDDKEGKPMLIHQVIGRKPILAFGNSDGDLQMLEWCASNTHPNLAAYIHHTDDEREWVYDRDSNVGRLDKGLDAAEKNSWLVVDMKKDWKVIYPERQDKPVAQK